MIKNRNLLEEKVVSNIARIVENIEKSLTCNLVYSAFFMSLALPDVCGKLKYKELSGNNRCRERYTRWFDEYVNVLLNPMKDSSEENVGLSFDANICYKVRCSLLHAGETDIGEDVTIDDFYIDTTTPHLKGSLFQGGIDLWSNESDNPLRTSLHIRGLLIVDCILQGTRTFLSDIEDDR